MHHIETGNRGDKWKSTYEIIIRARRMFLIFFFFIAVRLMMYK